MLLGPPAALPAPPPWSQALCRKDSVGSRSRQNARIAEEIMPFVIFPDFQSSSSVGCGREGLLLRRGLSTQPSLFHGGDGRKSALGAGWSRAGCAQAAASACASFIKVPAPQMLAGWGRCVVEARGRQSCHSIVQAQQHKSWQLCPISFLADLTARS